jgi:hypothetical protein
MPLPLSLTPSFIHQGSAAHTAENHFQAPPARGAVITQVNTRVVVNCWVLLPMWTSLDSWTVQDMSVGVLSRAGSHLFPKALVTRSQENRQRQATQQMQTLCHHLPSAFRALFMVVVSKTGLRMNLLPVICANAEVTLLNKTILPLLFLKVHQHLFMKLMNLLIVQVL